MNAIRFAASLFFVCSCSATALPVTIPTVPVGNPGNPADTRYLDWFHANGFGSVAYEFNIGKTEITNAQYMEFLDAVAATDTYGLYNVNMGDATWGGIVRSGASGSYSYTVKPAALGGAYSYNDKPVVFVSFGDAMRFANWLHNGQPSGTEDASTTEDGAYTMNEAITNAALSAVKRNAGAHWWLPNEDEWYKAAYHKNDGVTSNYWDYPTRTNSVANNNQPAADTGNSANFKDGNNWTTGNSIYPLTDAGAYAFSGSPYGTFDQGGNVWEWTETVDSSCCGIGRGGGWQTGLVFLRASNWDDTGLANEFNDQGFRVASAAVPELYSTTLIQCGFILAFSSRAIRRLTRMR
jgi:sulfatase modifying factor 1